jgi:micrococcal nuclease
MVMAGFARHYSKYSQKCANKDAMPLATIEDGIAQAEEIAISKKVGMWSNPNAVAPWDWRKQNR